MGIGFPLIYISLRCILMSKYTIDTVGNFKASPKYAPSANNVQASEENLTKVPNGHKVPTALRVSSVLLANGEDLTRYT